MAELSFKPEYGTIEEKNSTLWFDPIKLEPTKSYIVTSRHGGAIITWTRSAAEFWLTVVDATVRSRELRLS